MWRLALLATLVALTLPTCGGGSHPTVPLQPSPTPPPVTQPPTPTTLRDLSATVTSPQADTSINCNDDLRARVTLTNRGGTAVTVTAILDSTGIPFGDCFGEGDRTFRYSTPPTVFPNSTTVLMDQSLYANGPGCCSGRGCAGNCTFQQSFEVITDVGNVPAGSFNYKVFFQNCRSCPGSVAAAAGGRACASPLR